MKTTGDKMKIVSVQSTRLCLSNRTDAIHIMSCRAKNRHERLSLSISFSVPRFHAGSSYFSSFPEGFLGTRGLPSAVYKYQRGQNILNSSSKQDMWRIKVCVCFVLFFKMAADFVRCHKALGPFFSFNKFLVLLTLQMPASRLWGHMSCAEQLNMHAKILDSALLDFTVPTCSGSSNVFP